MSMSRKEFLQALAKTRRNWFLDDKCIRRGGPKGLECPISSILRRNVAEWDRVASFLGLSDSDAENIADAADCAYEQADDPNLRISLLQACGLTETGPTEDELQPEVVHVCVED